MPLFSRPNTPKVANFRYRLQERSGRRDRRLRDVAQCSPMVFVGPTAFASYPANHRPDRHELSEKLDGDNIVAAVGRLPLEADGKVGAEQSETGPRPEYDVLHASDEREFCRAT